MREFEIAPSLLSADFGYLMRDVEAVTPYCDYLHIDVMDGHYVPNLTIGIPVIKTLRPHTRLKFDTHLMITNPEKYIKEFSDAGSDIITFHIECSNEPFKLISEIRSLGKLAGVSIHPDTPIEKINPFTAKGVCDNILVMSVRPGFGGQSYMDCSNERISYIREKLDENGSSAVLSVDGGISEKTIRDAKSAGARYFVAGSSVFGKDDPGLAAKRLYDCLV